MAENVREIAALLGATVVGQVPQTGGGAFGAARLAVVVAALRAWPEPIQPPADRPDDAADRGNA